MKKETNRDGDTALDFKEIQSSPYTFNISRQHWGSHLYNFENRYDRYDAKLFAKLELIVDKLLSFDPEVCPRYVFLCGVPGNGKTHFMVGLYRALVKKKGYAGGNGATFIEFRELIADMIQGFDSKIPIRTALSAWTKPRVLLIDDITSGERLLKEGSMEQTVLRDIFIERYETKGTLVVSTNMLWPELNQFISTNLGEYVSSRTTDSIVAQFPKIDFRRRKQ